MDTFVQAVDILEACDAMKKLRAENPLLSDKDLAIIFYCKYKKLGRQVELIRKSLTCEG